jgi:hypothetical protein
LPETDEYDIFGLPETRPQKKQLIWRKINKFLLLKIKNNPLKHTK